MDRINIETKLKNYFKYTGGNLVPRDNSINISTHKSSRKWMNSGGGRVNLPSDARVNLLTEIADHVFLIDQHKNRILRRIDAGKGTLADYQKIEPLLRRKPLLMAMLNSEQKYDTYSLFHSCLQLFPTAKNSVIKMLAKVGKTLPVR